MTISPLPPAASTATPIADPSEVSFTWPAAAPYSSAPTANASADTTSFTKLPIRPSTATRPPVATAFFV
ncbi:MAG TPA: hypothetical protein DD658_10640 [Deltaproteobacteria bacterium]|nr:hypothetical protein [Deltaproteobacteria bacterium]